jgi:hypothetical protein
MSNVEEHGSSTLLMRERTGSQNSGVFANCCSTLPRGLFAGTKR